MLGVNQVYFSSSYLQCNLQNACKTMALANFTINIKIVKHLFTGSQIQWTSKVPKRFKRNAINGDLNRSYQISMNFDHEKETIREKYHQQFSLLDLLAVSSTNFTKS